MNQEHDFASVDELEVAYGQPSERAANKELTALDEHCRTIVAGMHRGSFGSSTTTPSPFRTARATIAQTR
jgi:hypothetical protein